MKSKYLTVLNTDKKYITRLTLCKSNFHIIKNILELKCNLVYDVFEITDEIIENLKLNKIIY